MKQVLTVDDSASVRQMVNFTLRNAGYAVTEAADGRQGLEKAKGQRFELVIDGQRIQAGSGRSYNTVDPFLGAPWATAADGDAGDVDLAVAAARRALAGPRGPGGRFRSRPP